MQANVIDRVRQRSLDVLDLADALAEEISLAAEHDFLRHEAVSTAQRILGCLGLLDEVPCALWALEELAGKAARMGAIFSIARARGLVDDEREREAVSLSMDLSELARALVRDSLHGRAHPERHRGSGGGDATLDAEG